MSYSHEQQVDRRKRQPFASIHSLSLLCNDDYGTTFPPFEANPLRQSPSRSILSADMPGCGLITKLKGWMDIGWQLRVFLLSLIFILAQDFCTLEYPEIGLLACTSL